MFITLFTVFHRFDISLWLQRNEHLSDDPIRVALTQRMRLVRVRGDRPRHPPLGHGALLRVPPGPIPTATGQPPRVRILNVPSAVTAGAAAFP